MILLDKDYRDYPKIREFFKRNEESLKNPVIANFLSIKENEDALIKALLEPTAFNRGVVDRKFREHYNYVKKIKYVSNLIYYFSIDFDKRERKNKERNQLILDKSVSDDSNTTVKDLIIDKKRRPEDSMGDRITDHLERKELIDSIDDLTYKQVEILELIYLQGLTLKEVSDVTKTTPQNISNQHRKIIRKIKNKIKNKMT